MNKTLTFLLVGVVSLVIGLVIGIALNKSVPLGGLVHNIQEDFKEGITVDTTEVIDGSGNWKNSASSTARFQLEGETNLQRVIFGGATTTISVGTTTVLTAANVCDNIRIEFAPLDVDSASTSLPAASDLTADCLEQDGDTISLFLVTNTTTDGYRIYFATSSTDLATGTTWHILSAASTTDTPTYLQATSENWIKATFHRLTSSLVDVIFERLSNQ